MCILCYYHVVQMAPIAGEQQPRKRLIEKLRESGDYAGHELALIRSMVSMPNPAESISSWYDRQLGHVERYITRYHEPYEARLYGPSFYDRSTYSSLSYPGSTTAYSSGSRIRRWMSDRATPNTYRFMYEQRSSTKQGGVTTPKALVRRRRRRTQEIFWPEEPLSKSPSTTYIRPSQRKSFDLEKKDSLAADAEFPSLASFRPSPRKRFDFEKKDSLGADVEFPSMTSSRSSPRKRFELDKRDILAEESEIPLVTYIRSSPRKRYSSEKKDALAADAEIPSLTSSIRRRHSSYLPRPESKYAPSGSVATSAFPIITTSIKPDGVKYHPHSNSSAQQEFEDIVRRRSRILPGANFTPMAAIAPEPYPNPNPIAPSHNGPLPSVHLHPMYSYNTEPSYLSSPYISGVLGSELSDPRYAPAQPQVVNVLMGTIDDLERNLLRERETRSRLEQERDLLSREVGSMSRKLEDMRNATFALSNAVELSKGLQNRVRNLETRLVDSRFRTYDIGSYPRSYYW